MRVKTSTNWFCVSLIKSELSCASLDKLELVLCEFEQGVNLCVKNEFFLPLPQPDFGQKSASALSIWPQIFSL